MARRWLLLLTTGALATVDCAGGHRQPAVQHHTTFGLTISISPSETPWDSVLAAALQSALDSDWLCVVRESQSVWSGSYWNFEACANPFHRDKRALESKLVLVGSIRNEVFGPYAQLADYVAARGELRPPRAVPGKWAVGKKTCVASLEVKCRTQEWLVAQAEGTWVTDLGPTTEADMRRVVADFTARSLLLNLAKQLQKRKRLAIDIKTMTTTSRADMEKRIDTWRVESRSTVSLRPVGIGSGQW